MTDAHLVLGNIGPNTRLGGHGHLDVNAALLGISRGLAEPLTSDPIEAAQATIEIADTSMARAIRVLTVERGLDPQDFALIAFGGAGPLHAVSLARGLGISRVIVPPHAGVLSAIGMLAADVRHDFVETHVGVANDLRAGTFQEVFGTLEEKALLVMQAEGHDPGGAALDYWLEMQYAGQNHQIPVRLQDRAALIDPADMLPRLFHDAHRARYGFAFEGEIVEVVQYGLTASAQIHPFHMPLPNHNGTRGPKLPGRREVWFGRDKVSADVIARRDLAPGDKVNGPAVIESDDTTIVLPPSSLAAVDEFAILTIDLG